MRRWLARIAVAPTGLRLCGMVEEPPLPAAAGSKASPTSDCMSSITSVAILLHAPESPASAAAIVEDAAALRMPGDRRLRAV